MEMEIFLLDEATSCRHNFWLGKAWQQSIKGKEHFQVKVTAGRELHPALKTLL